MTASTNWAVLTDGRYIRIFVHQNPVHSLHTLKADDSKDLADLCYQVVTGVPVGSKNGTRSRNKSNMELLAKFLHKQYYDAQYQKLILVAPQVTLMELKGCLSKEIKQHIKSEVAEDLLASSLDDIENKLSNCLN
jgi:hypothetical protein